MLTKEDQKNLEEILLQCSRSYQALHSWIEQVRNLQARIMLPTKIAEYDPDPAGCHGMSDQRRLDTAFEGFMVNFEKRLKDFMKV